MKCASKIGQSLENAIKFLHEHQLSHLDIKPDNILVLHDHSIRLIDFEHMSHWSQPFQITGTKGYMLPNTTEITDDIMEKADWYAFGKTILHLLSHVHQFQYICFNILENTHYQPPKQLPELLRKAIGYTTIT